MSKDTNPAQKRIDDAYEQIGRGVRLVARGYRDMYEASKPAAAK